VVGDQGGYFFSSSNGEVGEGKSADFDTCPSPPADAGAFAVSLAGETGDLPDARAMRCGGRMSEKEALRLCLCPRLFEELRPCGEEGVEPRDGGGDGDGDSERGELLRARRSTSLAKITGRSYA